MPLVVYDVLGEIPDQSLGTLGCSPLNLPLLVFGALPEHGLELLTEAPVGAVHGPKSIQIHKESWNKVTIH